MTRSHNTTTLSCLPRAESKVLLEGGVAQGSNRNLLISPRSLTSWMCRAPGALGGGTVWCTQSRPPLSSLVGLSRGILSSFLASPEDSFRNMSFSKFFDTSTELSLFPFSIVVGLTTQGAEREEVEDGGKDRPLVLRNQAPRWHEQLQCRRCLNFWGRVTVASVEDYKLIAANQSPASVPNPEPACNIRSRQDHPPAWQCWEGCVDDGLPVPSVRFPGICDLAQRLWHYIGLWIEEKAASSEKEQEKHGFSKMPRHKGETGGKKLGVRS